jgi:hypothetical protein
METQLTSAQENRGNRQFAGFRIGFISLLAAVIGLLAGLIAYLLHD